ncbi:MAG: metallo-beta-lactamase superfamily [Elusimicrobia bacterium]|nr:MAG: metallo-beta-lactamase superfamily [Elusimicrobiota bacterium]
MPTEVLIVDDDALVGGVSYEILTEGGYQAKLIRDSNLVMGFLAGERPKLVLLDILMPGIDGLTLLHGIKNDPALKSIRVAVVSGKTFSAEIDRAMQYGAEAFIKKPYDARGLLAKVAELIGPPDSPESKATEANPETPTVTGAAAMRLRVWGRSLPDDTPVLSIEAMDKLFLFDAGRGIAACGEAVLKEGRFKEAWWLLSHFHPDHVGGLGLNPLLRQEGFALRIGGPKEPGSSLANELREAVKRSYAADPRPVKAALKLHELKEDSYEIAPHVRLTPFYLNHPGTAMGYMLDAAGRRVVFSPDAELYGAEATAHQDYDEKIGRLIRGADLLVHDARYNEADHEKHKDEGHSSVVGTAGFAADNDIKRLILWHADPTYGEEQLSEMEAAAAAVLDERGAGIPVHAARDGFTLEF